MEYIDYLKKQFKISDFFDNKKPNGPNQYVASCPFHVDKTPSFFITEKDGMELFHCFSCHAGGTVIDFLMKKDNKNFTDIYEELSEKVGKTSIVYRYCKNTFDDD